MRRRLLSFFVLASDFSEFDPSALVLRARHLYGNVTGLLGGVLKSTEGARSRLREAHHRKQRYRCEDAHSRHGTTHCHHGTPTGSSCRPDFMKVSASWERLRREQT